MNSLTHCCRRECQRQTANHQADNIASVLQRLGEMKQQVIEQEPLATALVASFFFAVTTGVYTLTLYVAVE